MSTQTERLPVLLDARIRVGGPAVYAQRLIAGLEQLAGCQVFVLDHGGLVGRLTRSAFSPWGRAQVAFQAARVGARLVHGLHLEVPPGRLPAVVTVQDVVPLDHPASMPSRSKRVVYRDLLNRSLRRAERIIVPSPATASRLASLGAGPDRIDVIPLAIGPGLRPSSAAEREDARRRFASGRRYVVAATGVKAHKNLAGMSRAAAVLAPEIAVAATGRGPRRAAPGIVFVGVLGEDELRNFYGGAEAVVLPAFIEGFGLPAVEALACGVPVVCGPGIGALPYVRPGAVELDVTRPDELAAGILDLIGDDALRERLAIRGAEATSHLTATSMATATLAVYERVLADTSR